LMLEGTLLLGLSSDSRRDLGISGFQNIGFSLLLCEKRSANVVRSEEKEDGIPVVCRMAEWL
jgi:hypothetical protein